MSSKILLVHKRNVMLRLIQRHLEDAGYELIKARNGEEAIDAIEREKPRVVVVDDPMPFVPNPWTPGAGDAIRMHVIRLTDTPTPDGSARETPFQTIFTRPFSPTRLLAEIDRLSSISTKA